MGCYSGISFVGNKKIANIANTYSGVVCLVSKGKTMKRESGAKPEQTHCRKLHYEAPAHSIRSTVATMVMGRM